MIEMIFSLYQRLGLKNLKVYINSLGDKSAREAFRASFQAYLQPHLQTLSKESQTRFEVNPLRILDSKDEGDQAIVREAPSILDFLSEESRQHFEKVQAILSHLKIPYEINTRLVRGLDYYNNTVFEITSGHLGAQNSVAGGGRYDGLLKSLGGPDLSSLGFATGIERVIQALLHQGLAMPERPTPRLYIIPLGAEPQLVGFELAQAVRKEGIQCIVDLSNKKLKSCMQQADRASAHFVLVLGENEIKNKTVELKEMKTGQKVVLSLDAVAAFFKMRALSDRLHSDCKAMEEAVTKVYTPDSDQHGNAITFGAQAALLLNALSK
jgi:histidyl-tRNA synthetase